DRPFDYFDELLERIQEIRTSEKRFYQKITDIYATSIDYDPTAEISIQFFQTVQNKMHWAITGQTAAEIVAARADHTLPNMGLTSFRGAKVRKADVGIAKNYLSEDEIRALNNLTEQYLVFAQGQAMQRIPMHMCDWVAKLDAFITINGRNILADAGKISHELAQQKAEAEYDLFNQARIAAESVQPNDFDKFVANVPARRPRKKKSQDGDK
ncbi:MAG: hydroxyacid dehydrogenase, partial [Lentisphaerae bacterium]|nr:hydroxyacid dehydrogenase [Lentisphaerota bacterium]